MTEETQSQVPALIDLDIAEDSARMDADVLAKMAGGGDYFPRLQFMNANATQVKDSLFPMNHYALIGGNETIDLGPTVDVINAGFRQKAVDMNSDDFKVTYDDKSDEFRDIVNRADNIPNSGCAYGLEFLVYVPAVKKWAVVHFNNKSTRRIANVMLKLFKFGVTLASAKAENKNGAWWHMLPQPCNTISEIPAAEDIAKNRAKFAEEMAKKDEEAANEPATTETRER
jgi:hypothetical protein